MHSLRARPDGALVWSWHPSVKERRSQADVDWWAVLRAITPPTLVLRGAESPILDRDVAERMAKELPHGRFVEIPRAVHTLHEDNPEAVLAALKEFLGF
jgi:pimeloyl-ACP methyl ester carboxylesterase